MSAPTTEEVREALAMAERDDARASRSYSGGCDTAPGYEMALEVAEHRDALAAEVARLREAAAAVVACVGYDATMQRAVDRLASVLAEAKGAGR